MHNFRFFGAYTPSNNMPYFDMPSSSRYMNIDKSIVYGVLQPFYPSQVNLFVYPDEDFEIINVLTANHLLMGGAFEQRAIVVARMQKMTGDKWITAIDNAYDMFKVMEVE